MLGRADRSVPVAVDHDLSEQFRAMGAVVAPEAASLAEDEAFEVMRDNWTSVSIWLRCATQWRIVTSATAMIRIGLDYAGVDVVLRRTKGLADPDAVFDDLIQMETEALRVIRESAA